MKSKSIASEMYYRKCVQSTAWEEEFDHNDSYIIDAN